MPKIKSILIVDDNELEFLFLSDSFKKAGIKNRLVYVKSGQGAFDKLKKDNADVFMIICDINMPDMTGIELKRKLNSQDSLRNIPFIFITHSRDEEELVKAYELNTQGYFLKTDLESQITLIKRIVELWKNVPFVSH